METKKLPLVGKGLFSKVYKLNEKQVLIKSCCNVKECISMEWHSSTVFPKLECTEYQTYVCEYYPKVKSLKESLKPLHYKIYLELKSLSIGYVDNFYDFADHWANAFSTITNKKYRLALQNMLECLRNYGSDISFEISPRNVAVKDGKLILLDVFFMISQHRSARDEQKQRRSNRSFNY